MKNLYLTLFTAAFLLTACGSGDSRMENSRDVLMSIGDQVITVQEFIRRAEYTPRPAWCSGDSYIHRKIVLNSLLAEKLFALDLAADDSIRTMQAFQDLLEGRKTQAMRQILYKKEALDRIATDSAAVMDLMDRAGRNYEISFMPVYRDRLPQDTESAAAMIRDHFEELPAEAVNRTEINWNSDMDEDVFKTLYQKDVRKGDILGPFEFDDSLLIAVRVDGWKKQMIIGDVQFRERFRTVDEKLKSDKASGLWETYVAGIMKGRQFELQPSVFAKLVEFLAPIYLTSAEEKQELFNKNFWDDRRADDPGLPDLPELDPESVLMTYDGESVTLGEFRRMLATHPLVFRSGRLTKRNFPEQLKFAVADLLRDRELDAEAYRRGLDVNPAVLENVAMWEANFLARARKMQLLKDAGFSDPEVSRSEETVETLLEPKFRELLTQYSDSIQINFDLFENTALSSIDMIVLQKQVPYPVIVPDFPVFTKYDRIDYGRKMFQD